MLGQPVYFLTPDVIGVHLTGELPQGATATDLVLRITEMLRKANVVGKFVEFFGEGAAALHATDRATIANMAPEYGATMGFFPMTKKRWSILQTPAGQHEHVETIRNYYTTQQMFGIPREGEIDYTTVLELNLATVNAVRRRAKASAGPHRAVAISTTGFSNCLQNRSPTAAMERRRTISKSGSCVTMGAQTGELSAAAATKTDIRFRCRSSSDLVSHKNTNVYDRDRDDEQPPDAGSRRHRRTVDARRADRAQISVTVTY